MFRVHTIGCLHLPCGRRLLAQELERCVTGAAVILGGGELRAEQRQLLGLVRVAEGAGSWCRLWSLAGGGDALGEVAGCVVMHHGQPQTSACESAAGTALSARSRYAVASQRSQGSGSVDSQPFPSGKRRMGSARLAASSVGATFARKRARSSSGGASSTRAADKGSAAEGGPNQQSTSPQTRRSAASSARRTAPPSPASRRTQASPCRACICSSCSALRLRPASGS